VVLGGMVSSVRTVLAKSGKSSGKRMGIVTLEDLKGRVEAIVFPNDLETYRSLLMPDRIAFLEGEVDRKREEPSLRVSRVIAVDRAAEELGLAMLIDVARGAAIEEIVAVLRQHRAPAAQPERRSRRGPHGCPVYLNVETENELVAQIECHPSLRVTCTPELLAALIPLVGGSGVSVLGPRRLAIPLPGSFQAATAAPKRAVEGSSFEQPELIAHSA